MNAHNNLGDNERNCYQLSTTTTIYSLKTVVLNFKYNFVVLCTIAFSVKGKLYNARFPEHRLACLPC